MPRVITINIGNNGVVLAIQKGKKITNKIFVRNLTENTEEKLRKIFIKHKNYPVYILLDTVAQNYVHKTFPSVNRFDLLSIVNRKFKQEVPANDLKTKILMEKEKDTGRWNYMFISAPIVSPLKEWLELLRKLPNMVVGIHFVPLEIKGLLKSLSKKLSIKNKWVLFITQNKASDLREIAFKDNKLMFTRLLTYQDDDIGFAKRFNSDVLRTIEYLRRISSDFNTNDLSIITITEEKIKNILAAEGFKDFNLIAKTPYEIASMLGIPEGVSVTDSFADILIRNSFIASRTKQIRFKTPEIRIYEKLYFLKLGLRFMVAMSLISLLGLFSYYSFYKFKISSNINKENVSIKSKEETLKGKKQEQFGLISVDIDQIIDTGKISEMVYGARIDPLPLFKKIGTIKKDIFTINNLYWNIGNMKYNNLQPMTDFSAIFKVNLQNPSGNIEDLFTKFDSFSKTVKDNFSNYEVTHSKLPTNIDFNSLYYNFMIDLNIKGKNQVK